MKQTSNFKGMGGVTHPNKEHTAGVHPNTAKGEGSGKGWDKGSSKPWLSTATATPGVGDK